MFAQAPPGCPPVSSLRVGEAFGRSGVSAGRVSDHAKRMCEIYRDREGHNRKDTHKHIQKERTNIDTQIRSPRLRPPPRPPHHPQHHRSIPSLAHPLTRSLMHASSTQQWPAWRFPLPPVSISAAHARRAGTCTHESTVPGAPPVHVRSSLQEAISVGRRLTAGTHAPVATHMIYSLDKQRGSGSAQSSSYSSRPFLCALGCGSSGLCWRFHS